LKRKIENMLETGNSKGILENDFNWRFETILPKVTYLVPCNFPLNNADRMALTIKWKAKNGLWDQILKLQKIADGRWLQSTIVRRNDVEIFSQTDDGYFDEQTADTISAE
jgi:hypothetical protein